MIAAIPHTEPWGFNTALVMIICNLVAMAIGRLAISAARHGLGATRGQFNFSLPELIATLSFGHIIGVGFVLGLTNIGTI